MIIGAIALAVVIVCLIMMIRCLIEMDSDTRFTILFFNFALIAAILASKL